MYRILYLVLVQLEVSALKLRGKNIEWRVRKLAPPKERIGVKNKRMRVCRCALGVSLKSSVFPHYFIPET